VVLIYNTNMKFKFGHRKLGIVNSLYATISGVTISRSNPELEDLKKKTLDLILGYSDGRIDNDEVTAGYVDILKVFGQESLVPAGMNVVKLVKERNKYLVNLAKQQWLKENNGTVSCAICSFSFDDTYGDVCKGYIEAHHILPISALTSDTIMKIKDLSPVCSNCHSVIHRYRPWLTINQLKDNIRIRK